MEPEPLFHPRTAAALESITREGTASYIFHGHTSSGKLLATVALAQRLNCDNAGSDGCQRCVQIAHGNYTDYIVVQPDEKTTVTIDQIRRLLGGLALAPYRAGGTRLVVIDEAHTLSTEAQNALLKSLEEPPPGTRFVLITSSIEALLPTVRSRLAAIYFAPLPESMLAAWIERGYHLKPAVASQVAMAANGVVGEAVKLASSPDYAEAQLEQAKLIARMLGGSRFSRLTAARLLTDTKMAPNLVIDRLQHEVVHRLTTGNHDTASRRQIEAITAARRLAASGVAARVVFDRLAVEL